MLKNLQKRNAGFTIVEVMIVLAIAGLIILVVLLAVPALQRNSRNSQRTSDATQVAGIVNECLGNRNGVTTSCDSTAELVGLDTNKLSILKTVGFGTGFPADTSSINIAFSSTCASDGSSRVASTNTRQFAVLFNTENSSNGNVPKCVEA